MTIRDAVARVRGEWLRAKLYLTSRGRVVIGPGLRAYVTPEILGPGRVHIGSNVSFDTDAFGLRRPSLQTIGSPDAKIEIQDGVSLLGTHVSCSRRVTVGQGAWLEDARVMDADFHAKGRGADRHRESTDAAKEVSIGAGTRVGSGVLILKGAQVGTGSRVRPGTVVLRRVPDDTVVSGYPARPEKDKE